MTVTEEGSSITPRKSLLEKYDIPVNHLDFDYVKKCSNVKEIGRILKILRSHEEGYYPDLIKCTEERLRCLDPDSRLLREQAPVLTKDSLSKDEWEGIINDIEEWKGEIELKEKNLKGNTVEKCTNLYPGVRRGNRKLQDTQAGNSGTVVKPERIKSTDYNKWNKYDPDAEILKMDIEEEKKREENKISEKIEKEKAALTEDEEEVEKLKAVAARMDEEERKLFALKEKDVGNEFYHSREFDKALRHYTRSITILPTAPGHNNRAATYLKQCKYSKALLDLNKALELEPGNVKALYRRALCLQHKNEFHKALDDMREVLKREPNHVVARHIADQLREHCSTVPRKVRLMVKNDDPDQETQYIECTEEEMMRDYQDPKYVEVNEEGLPKVKCANCVAKYANIYSSHGSETRFQHLRDRNKTENKIVDLNAQDVRTSVKENQTRRLTIMELDKIPVVKAQELKEKNLGNSGKGDQQHTTSKSIAMEISENTDKLFRVDIKDVGLIAGDANKGTKKDLPEKESSVKLSYESSAMETSEDTTNQLVKVDIKDVDSFTEANGPVGGRQIMEILGKKCTSKQEGTSDKESSSMAKTSQVNVDNKLVSSPGGNEDLPTYEECTKDKNKPSSSHATTKESLKRDVTPMQGGSSTDENKKAEHKPKVRKKDKTRANEARMSEVHFYDDIENALENTPISVAKKYQKKTGSRSQSKSEQGTDSPRKMEQSQLGLMSQASFIETYSPYQFWLNWSSIEENAQEDLRKKSQLLRSIRPHLLQAVIGNKLDDKMLSTFLKCLRFHFNLQEEATLVTEYLTTFTQLERFKIIYSFLSSEDKSIVRSLVEILGCGDNSELQKLFELKT